jgi:hypothetical protein
VTSPMRGGRSPRANYLAMRLGLLAVLIVGGAIFHHRGPAYDVIHVLYIVALVGFIGWRIMRRRQRAQPYRDPDPHRPT